MQTLTPNEKIILNKLLTIQINNLDQILDALEIYGVEVYSRYEIELSESEKTPQSIMGDIQELHYRREIFYRVKEKPETLWEMDSEKIGIMKHILFNFGEKWEALYPKSVKSLWFKLVGLSMVHQNLGLN